MMRGYGNSLAFLKPAFICSALLLCFSLNLLAQDSAKKSDFFKRLGADAPLRGSYGRAGSKFAAKADILRIQTMPLKAEKDLAAFKAIVDKAQAENRLDGLEEALADEYKAQPSSLPIKISLAFTYGAKAKAKEEFALLKDIESQAAVKPKLAFNIIQAYGRLKPKSPEGALDSLFSSLAEAKASGELLWVFLDTGAEAKKWIERAIAEKDWDFAAFLVEGALSRSLIDDAYAQEKFALILESSGGTTVRNALEFYKALKSNRLIICEAGVYDLRQDFESAFVTFDWDNYEDGLTMPGVMRSKAYPRLKGLSNVSIRAKGRVVFVARAISRALLEFDGCKNISMDGIAFEIEDVDEYSSQYGLDGLVLTSCAGISMRGCSIEGNGIRNGLVLRASRNVRFENSEITNCGGTILDISNSQSLSFINSSFKDSRAHEDQGEYYQDGSSVLRIGMGRYDPFRQGSSSDENRVVDCVFSACSFSNNAADQFLDLAVETTRRISMDSCRFTGNKTEHFSMYPWFVSIFSQESELTKLPREILFNDYFSFINCSFTANDFHLGSGGKYVGPWPKS